MANDYLPKNPCFVDICSVSKKGSWAKLVQSTILLYHSIMMLLHAALEGLLDHWPLLLVLVSGLVVMIKFLKWKWSVDADRAYQEKLYRRMSVKLNRSLRNMRQTDIDE